LAKFVIERTLTGLCFSATNLDPVVAPSTNTALGYPPAFAQLTLGSRNLPSTAEIYQPSPHLEMIGQQLHTLNHFPSPVAVPQQLKEQWSLHPLPVQQLQSLCVAAGTHAITDQSAKGEITAGTS